MRNPVVCLMPLLAHNIHNHKGQSMYKVGHEFYSFGIIALHAKFEVQSFMMTRARAHRHAYDLLNMI